MDQTPPQQAARPWREWRARSSTENERGRQLRRPLLRDHAALVAHTSGTFATDLAAGNWVLIVDFSTIALVAASLIAVTPSGSLTTDAQKLAAGAGRRQGADIAHSRFDRDLRQHHGRPRAAYGRHRGCTECVARHCGAWFRVGKHQRDCRSRPRTWVVLLRWLEQEPRHRRQSVQRDHDSAEWHDYQRLARYYRTGGHDERWQHSDVARVAA
jgi:hypothetical protein